MSGIVLEAHVEDGTTPTYRCIGTTICKGEAGRGPGDEGRGTDVQAREPTEPERNGAVRGPFFRSAPTGSG